MNSKDKDIFILSSEKERLLFTSANFFFDTSALLDFYYFSDIAKKEIFEKVFSLLKNRLWITKQTEFEFLKNRAKVSNKPYQTYLDLVKKNPNTKDGGHVEEIGKLIISLKDNLNNNVQGHIKTLIEKTSKSDKHPFFTNELFKEFQLNAEAVAKHLVEFENNFSSFKDSLEAEMEQKKNSLQSTIDNDPVLNEFYKYFSTTNGFLYKEIMCIISEGELRYRNQIPPGYLDYEDKLGFQKYGDLILWKEIIYKCKADKMNVILIINDLTEDWWYHSDKKIPAAPRFELIKELHDEAGVQFWMFDINNFLHKSKQYFATALPEETIEEAKEVVLPNYENIELPSAAEKRTSELNRVRTSYVIIGYRTAIDRDRYAQIIKNNSETELDLRSIRPVLLPPLLRNVFTDLKIGDIIHFSKNLAYNEFGHFAGFRKDDIAITLHYKIRIGISVSKGQRYTVEVEGAERRINFVSK